MYPAKAAKIFIKSYESKRFEPKQSNKQGPPFSPLLVVLSIDFDVRTLLQQYIAGKERRLHSVLMPNHMLPRSTVFLPTVLHQYCTF